MTLGEKSILLWKALDITSRYVRFGSYIEIFSASPQDQSRVDNFFTAYENARGLGVRVNAFVNINQNGYSCNANFTDFEALGALTSSTTGYNYPIHPMDIASVVSFEYLETKNR
ncbi:unnamed protein product [Cylicostephanus goldi]|uniref:Uncharacterized protein n=1 Tax=Cylicostephanus goldi TaxID=71465 RepID=A0A3P6RK17_CYLGO|nr:unnamed protein product [Cylicostephanus goldi]